MQRYFVEKDAIKLPYIFITGDDCHHIGLVMRMKSGDKVYVSDQEKSYIAVITDIKKDFRNVVVRINSKASPAVISNCLIIYKDIKIYDLMEYRSYWNEEEVLIIQNKQLIEKLNNTYFVYQSNIFPIGKLSVNLNIKNIFHEEYYTNRFELLLGE